MKTINIPLRHILYLGLFMLSTQSSATELVDRIVALTGNDVVTYSELRDQARTLYTKLHQAKTTPMPTEEQILKGALDRLILEKLQLAEASRLGIQAEPDTLAKAIASIAKNNNISLQELRQTLSREGTSYKQFQNKVRNQIVIQHLINREVVNRIQIAKSEVDQQLARQNNALQGRQAVHLLHILINTPYAASPEQIAQVRERANAIRQQLDEGDDFKTIAQAYSDGNQAISGGDLGWLPTNQLPLTFSEQLKNANLNDIAGPFRSNSGFHILKVLGFRGDKVKPQIIRQTKARHILIHTNEITSDAEAQARLNQLRDRIIGGEDFATLARSNSADQASAIKGGDLGWVSPGNFVPQFEQQMDKTEAGQTSKPFKTRFGWHIVQVLERRQHDASEETQRSAARKAVHDRKAKEAKEQYLRRLRDESYVEIHLNG
jgi:peptidyl-prolyl cis-trans isomerase SurA